MTPCAARCAALAALLAGAATTSSSQCPGSPAVRVLFAEGFEDANLAGRQWYDNTGSVALSTAEHVGGARSIEFRFPPGARTPAVGGGYRRKFTPTDRVILRYFVKYSANWEGSNRPYHPHEFHFLTSLDSDWVGPAFTHLTTYVEQNEGTPMLGIQDGANVDQSRPRVDLVGVTEVRGVAGCNGDSDGHGLGDCYLNGALYFNGKTWRAPTVMFSDAPGPFYKGDWHLVEALFQLNTVQGGIGRRDGRIAYWFDGVPVFDHRDVVFRTGQNPWMLFQQLLVAPYIGDGSPVDQTMWVDDLAVGIPVVGLLRNDEVASLSPVAPPLAGIFTGGGGFGVSLVRDGPDACAQEGEGAMLSVPGSSDDDDWYVSDFVSGSVDPDSPDPARPLVLYELDLATDTLRVTRDPSGRVVISY